MVRAVRVVAGINRRAARRQAVERWQGQEQVAAGDQARHLAEEERHQQAGDVGAVDVGIGHDHDALIAQAVDVEALAATAAQRLGKLLVGPLTLRRGAGDV